MFDQDEYLSQNDDNQFKEIYARFGLSIFHFQVLEHQLINMVISFYKLQNLKMNKDEFNDLFHEFSDKTMGKLIQKVAVHYELEEEIKTELWLLHRKRNFFVHHYFKDMSFGWDTPEQRIEIIKELDNVSDRSQKLDGVLTKMLFDKLKPIGISETDLDKARKKMRSGELQDRVFFREKDS